MDFKKAEISFILLREKLEAEKISPQEFEQEIQHLRVQQQDGSHWQPRADGMWLRWDGQNWQETGKRMPQKLPLSKRIFRFMRHRAFQMILSAVFAWALHTYMLVVLNEGFGPSTVWGKWVNTVGNTPSSTLIWALFSMLAWSFIYSLFTYGPVTTVANFVKAPFSSIGMMTSAGVPGFGAISMGMGMALFVSSVLRLNAPANIALGVVWTFFGLSQIGQFATQYIIKGWFKIIHQSREKFNYRAAQLIVLGLTPGFLLCSVLSPKISTGLGILFLIVGVALFFAPQTPRPTMGQISGLLLFGALTSALYALLAWLLKDCAFADDGGSKECGGTFKGWVKCQGSGMAVARGAPPAAASAAGATIAIPINPMDPSTIPPRYELNGYVWFNPPDDEGGWQWMKKEDYIKVNNLMNQGLIWGGTKFGWMQPSDLQQAQQQYQQWQDANRRADAEFNARIKAEQDALKLKQQQEFLRQKYIAYLKDRQTILEYQQDKANAIAATADNYIFVDSSIAMDAAAGATRELVTGVNPDGNLSIPGLIGRIGAGVLTGGQSEYAFYIPANSAYRLVDGVANGESIPEAMGNAVVYGGKETIKTYLMGKAIEKGIQGVGAGYRYLKGAGNSVDDMAGAAGSTIDDAAVAGSAELPKHLQSKLAQLKDAVASGDEEAIKALYRNGGMKDLSALERAGYISADEAAACNNVVKNTVTGAMDDGMKAAGKDFHAKTGVRVEEGYVGQSGSNVSKFTKQTMNTDADGALMAKFNQQDLQKYADDFYGGDTSAAYDDLSKVYRSNVQGQVNNSLRNQKLCSSEDITGPNDLDVNMFDRFGKTAGRSDNYPANQVRVNQQVSGQTRVYKFDEGGNMKNPYNSSGQTMTDQEALLAAQMGDDSLLQSQVSGGSKMAGADANALIKQQMKAVSKPDVPLDKAAKGYQRAYKAEGIDEAAKAAQNGYKGPPPTAGAGDPNLAKLANAIRQDPQYFYQNLTPAEQQQLTNLFSQGVNDIAKGMGH